MGYSVDCNCLLISGFLQLHFYHCAAIFHSLFHFYVVRHWLWDDQSNCINGLSWTLSTPVDRNADWHFFHLFVFNRVMSVNCSRSMKPRRHKNFTQQTGQALYRTIDPSPPRFYPCRLEAHFGLPLLLLSGPRFAIEPLRLSSSALPASRPRS